MNSVDLYFLIESMKYIYILLYCKIYDFIKKHEKRPPNIDK